MGVTAFIIRRVIAEMRTPTHGFWPGSSFAPVALDLWAFAREGISAGEERKSIGSASGGAHEVCWKTSGCQGSKRTRGVGGQYGETCEGVGSTRPQRARLVLF